MRWERHWWQKTEPVEILRKSEPTVWIDPDLYVEDEAPTQRLARGTIPPPVCVGPYSELELDEPTVVTGELVVPA